MPPCTCKGLSEAKSRKRVDFWLRSAISQTKAVNASSTQNHCLQLVSWKEIISQRWRRKEIKKKRQKTES